MGKATVTSSASQHEILPI